MKLLNNDGGLIATAVEILSTAKEFGETPKYSYERLKNGKICVCKNDGQFQFDDSEQLPGYATFIGHFSDDYIENNYDEFLKVPEALSLGLVEEG